MSATSPTRQMKRPTISSTSQVCLLCPIWRQAASGRDWLSISAQIVKMSTGRVMNRNPKRMLSALLVGAPEPSG
jgi:hypothetical protein